MNRIILVLVILTFVQLVKGQLPSQACVDATTALSTDSTCTAAFTAGTDFSAICMGSCRTLFDNIINNCDATTGSTYSNVIDTLCGQCGTAQQALAANTACTTAFTTGTDASSLCTGTCRDLLNDIISNCDAATSSPFSTLISTICDGGTNTGDAACTAAVFSVSDDCTDSLGDGDTSVCSGTCAAQLNAVVSACGTTSQQEIQQFLGLYNILCGSSAACRAATIAVSGNATCNTDDVAVLCVGTCSGLADTFFNACPANNAVVILLREEYNRVCGSGSMLKASGVITLLIVAITALIF